MIENMTYCDKHVSSQKYFFVVNVKKKVAHGRSVEEKFMKPGNGC